MWETIFIAFLSVCGLVFSYGLIARFFNHKPQYVTDSYRVKLYWYKIKPMENFEKIDEALLRTILHVHIEYPGIKKQLMVSKIQKLRIHIMHDWDNIMYQRKPCGVDPSWGTGKIELQVGVRIGNDIYLRRTSPDILKTDFLHQVVHYLVEETGILPDEDRHHDIPYLWENGILGKVKKEMS
jgi:hypothetical protein